MLKNYSRKAPRWFKDKYPADVYETFSLQCEHYDLKQSIERLRNNPNELLKKMESFRSKIVGPLSEPDLEYISSQELIIGYKEEKFKFRGRLKILNGELVFHCGVSFKGLRGKLYFWSIYPVHLAVFFIILKKLAKSPK